jgi:hypothetical protein
MAKKTERCGEQFDFSIICPPVGRQYFDSEGLTASGAVHFHLQVHCLQDITSEFERCMKAALEGNDANRVMRILTKAERLYQGYADVGFNSLAPVAASIRQTLYAMHRLWRRHAIRRWLTHPNDLDIPLLVRRLECEPRDEDFHADLDAARHKIVDPAFNMTTDLKPNLD